MKALIKKYKERGIWMEEVPEPQCKTNEVKIKITRTSICGTDLHIFLWDEWAKRTLDLPLVIGHEFCGIIEEVGPGVSHYKPGQIVSGEGHITCGICRNCRAGKRHVCDKTIGIAVSDKSNTIATPIKTIQRKSVNIDINEIFKLVEEYNVGGLVFGLPLSLDGNEN